MTAQNGDIKTNGGTPLGLAGNLAKGFISSPLSPLLLVACLALGLVGLVLTPRQEDPQISVPMVDVFFSYQGMSSDQVAALATDPLERLMSEIPGVEHVYSVSQRDGAMVTVQFEVGEEMGPSLVKLNDKIQSNLDKIPPGVSQPLIKPKGVDDVPVVTLTLWSHSLDEGALRSLGLDVMQRLKEVPNTAQSFVVGGRSDAIKVEVFPERLAGFGIGLDEIAMTIRSANSERGVGHVEAGDTSFTLYTGSFLKTARDIENLMIGVRQGAPTYIRDVALVTEGTDDATSMVQYHTGPAYGHHGHGDEEHAEEPGVLAPIGAPAVSVAVAKKSGSNGVTVANQVLSYVEGLKGSLIPGNVQVEVTRNYGETANEKVNELIFKLFVVTGAVTLLIWAALGFRAALVVLIVIPIVILITVFMAWVLGYTIDRVSLFALIFSIGILVDDAIVVVENIYRRWLQDGSASEAVSIDAVREVGNPTVLATLTVIAALLPMGFVRGMMGPYMLPIPVLGSVAMVFSLFAAFIFTPYLAQRIKPSMRALKKAEAREHRQSKKMHGFYSGLLVPLVTKPLVGWGFAALLLLTFALSLNLFATTGVTVKMLPKDNKSEFNVTVNMPEGTPLPMTANVVARLAEQLQTMPEVVALQSYTGTASPFNFNGLVRHSYMRQDTWMADIQVQLTPKHDRDRSSEDLAVVAREMLTPVAQEMGARIEVVEMPPGPPVLQTMVAEIYGPDDATRRQVARDVEELFREAEVIVDVDSYLQMPYAAMRFVVDREKASRRGVSVEDINRQLEMAMGGFRLGDVKNERAVEPRFIYLQVPLALRGQFGRLGQLPIPSASGEMIPLTELGHFESFQKDEPVYHKDLRAVEYVTGDVTGRLGAPIYGILEMEDLLDGYTAPDGVRVDTNYIGPPSPNSLASALEWTGEWTVTYETFRDMGIAFALALVLIYMLVVWEFGNFITPAIVMVPIPLTLIGIVPGHWMLGASFTATSMIGFIALAGIIVRNSILLVDFSIHQCERGVSPLEAVITACQTRTRPIIITAMALIVGSSVILSDPIFQGMAISLMFGGLVSTLLTLVVIPLGCVSFPSSLRKPGSDGGTPATPTPSPSPQSGGAADVALARAQAERSGGVLRGTWEVARGIAILLWMVLRGIGKGLGALLGFSRPKAVMATAYAAPTPASAAGPAARTSAFAPAPKPQAESLKPAETPKSAGSEAKPAPASKPTKSPRGTAAQVAAAASSARTAKAAPAPAPVAKASPDATAKTAAAKRVEDASALKVAPVETPAEPPANPGATKPAPAKVAKPAAKKPAKPVEDAPAPKVSPAKTPAEPQANPEATKPAPAKVAKPAAKKPAKPAGASKARSKTAAKSPARAKTTSKTATSKPKATGTTKTTGSTGTTSKRTAAKRPAGGRRGIRLKDQEGDSNG